MTRPAPLELRTPTPYENMTSAIAILQAAYLAQDATLNAEAVFGSSYLKDDNLLIAIALLLPVQDQFEDLKGWAFDPPAVTPK